MPQCLKKKRADLRVLSSSSFGTDLRCSVEKDATWHNVCTLSQDRTQDCIKRPAADATLMPLLINMQWTTTTLFSIDMALYLTFSFIRYCPELWVNEFHEACEVEVPIDFSLTFFCVHWANCYINKTASGLSFLFFCLFLPVHQGLVTWNTYALV